MSTVRPMGNVTGIYLAQVSVDLANTPAISTAETTVTVPGVIPGDAVIVNKPSASAGLGVAGARVSAADTVVITTVNPTAAAINPAAEVYAFLILRPDGVAPAGIE